MYRLYDLICFKWNSSIFFTDIRVLIIFLISTKIWDNVKELLISLIIRLYLNITMNVLIHVCSIHIMIFIAKLWYWFVPYFSYYLIFIKSSIVMQYLYKIFVLVIILYCLKLGFSLAMSLFNLFRKCFIFSNHGSM